MNDIHQDRSPRPTSSPFQNALFFLGLAASGASLYRESNKGDEREISAPTVRVDVVRSQIDQVVTQLEGFRVNVPETTPSFSMPVEKLKLMNPAKEYHFILDHLTMEMLYVELDAALLESTDSEFVDEVRSIYEPAYDELEGYLNRQKNNPQAICMLLFNPHLEGLSQWAAFTESQLPLLKLLMEAIVHQGAAASQIEC